MVSPHKSYALTAKRLPKSIKKGPKDDSSLGPFWIVVIIHRILPSSFQRHLFSFIFLNELFYKSMCKAKKEF